MVEDLVDGSNEEFSEKNDYSFRPYYVKKTNREYKRANQSQEKHIRSSTRPRKTPDRYQA